MAKRGKEGGRKVTGVDEKKGGVVEGDDGTGLPFDMVLALEEADEGVADLGRRPLHRRRRGIEAGHGGGGANPRGAWEERVRGEGGEEERGVFATTPPSHLIFAVFAHFYVCILHIFPPCLLRLPGRTSTLSFLVGICILTFDP